MFDVLGPALVILATAAVVAGAWWWLRSRAASSADDGGTDDRTPTEIPRRAAKSVRGPPHRESEDDAGSAAPGGADAAHPGHDLRFTLYRPGIAVPGRWYDLLVFLHPLQHPSLRLATELSIEQRVERQARRILAEDAPTFASATEDAAAPVPRGGELTFTVELPGFRVNPARQTVAWHEDVQHVRFRIRAEPAGAGHTTRGRLTVFHGPLILAEMALVIPVGEAIVDPVTESLVPYRKIFASYAREDGAIVRQVAAFTASVGDRYLRDVTSLRAGEEWDPGLARLIEQADLFQLFWSWNAMESEWVRREWTHALSLGRKGFVRPVYWQEPLPSHPERGLPPPELSELHFHRLPPRLTVEPSGTVSLGYAAQATPPPPPPAPREAKPRRRIWARPAAAAAVAVLAFGTSTLLLQDSGLDMSHDGFPDPGNLRVQGSDPEPDAMDSDDDRTPPPRRDEAPAAPLGSIRMEVFLDDAPAGDVRVRIDTSDGRLFEGLTSAAGVLTLDGLPAGLATVTVAHPPPGTVLVGQPPDVWVAAGDTTHVTLRLARGDPPRS